MASHAEESHLRVLLKPCVNLSIHTASDVRLPTLKNRQWGKSVGLARRTRANHCLAPLERPRAFVCGRPGTCAASTQLLLLTSIASTSILSWSTAAGIGAATVCDIKRSSSLGWPAV